LGKWLKGAAIAALGGLIANPLTAASPVTKIDSVAVVGTDLRVALSDGRTLAGDGLVGVVLGLRNEGGAVVRVRIEAVMPDPKDKTAEVFLYRFTALDVAGAWQPVCAPDPDGRPLAIPQPGVAGTVAIWCTAGALAKCVRFGYHPWGQLRDGTPLARYHSACVNMVRADYTGDDRPTTRNGMLIDIFDHIGINAPEPGPGAMPFEAAWGDGGAICVAHVRVPQNISLDRLVAIAPRFAGRVGETCTEAAAATWGEPLLFNRSRGDGVPGR
jgi:hypothetical protein